VTTLSPPPVSTEKSGALSAAGEVLPDRSTAAAILAIASLLLAPVKWTLTVLTPRGADNTYAQRYQAARFVQRYYEGRSIATGELGHLSLFHQGPLTDILGLADYDVLVRRRQRSDSQLVPAGRMAIARSARERLGRLGVEGEPDRELSATSPSRQPGPQPFT
jgi:hypothetical protein